MSYPAPRRAADPSERRRLAARLNARQRHHGPDDPRTLDAARDLTAATASDYLTRLVDQAPALSAEQLTTLRAILDGGPILDATCEGAGPARPRAGCPPQAGEDGAQVAPPQPAHP